MAKTIGTVTTYDGNEHPDLHGHMARIVAVLRRASALDFDLDRDGVVLREDDEIDLAGGVTAHDHIEVQPWLQREQRWSFVTSDPRAIDLACFRHLAKTR